jgi:hypothetical protein
MVSSVLQPEKIIGKQKPTKEQALSFVSGGSSLGSSVLSGAKNKIVNFDRAKVSAKPNNLQALISNLSSTVFNTTNTIQNIFGNKETKEKKSSKFFGGFFDKFKEALAFITFFGAKKNLDRVKENIDNLKTTFTETFDVAKALRKAILKIIEQISGLSGGGGGGGLLGAIMSALGGLAAGLVPGMAGKRAPNIAGPAMKQEGNLLSKLPKGLKGGGGGIGKLLLGGTAALGVGSVVNGLSQPGGEDVQPGDTAPEVPGNVLDKFNSILDRFDKILDGLKGKPGKSSGASSGSGSSSKPASPGAPPGGSPSPGGAPTGVTIKDDKQGLSELGITQEQFNAYKQGIADVEGARYNQMGGSGGRFAGRYQMGSGEIASASAVMGIPNPSQQEYLSNPELQEKIYMGRTILMNRRMMQLSPEYKSMSATERLSNLAGAQLGEGSLTDFLKGKKISDSAGVEIQRWINSAKRRMGQVAAGKPIPQAPTKPGQQAPQAPSSSKPGPQPIQVIPFQSPPPRVQPASSGGGGQISAPPSPQQNGPTAPFYPSTNYDNFLTLYSRMVYNIVDG